MTFPMQTEEKNTSAADVSYVGSPTAYRIARQGGRPISFSGTEIGMAMSFTPGMPYWYEINLYHTNSQSVVVAIRLFYSSEDQNDIVKSWEFDSIDHAMAHLEHYDAGADVVIPDLSTGANATAELAAMAMSLQSQVNATRMHFAGLVGEFLAEVDQKVASH